VSSTEETERATAEGEETEREETEAEETEGDGGHGIDVEERRNGDTGRI
jgi:hypothetical protein